MNTEFPFESRFVEVEGAKMHYIDEGEGEPVLFLHGNPTSSYLWRNIIPHLSPHARCIAPDLIGMGRSDKPDIDYSFVDHSRYLEAFIQKLDLSNITLVVHDWGSGLGFHYARRHAENVRALAFMEAIVRPMRWDSFPKSYKIGFKLFRTPGVGWLMISVGNLFVKKLLPAAIIRPLQEEEKKAYASPFKSVKSRTPIRRWPQEIPIDGYPAVMQEIVEKYSSWLQETDLPKLLIHAEPGGILDKETVAWCKKSMPNLKDVFIGKGIHYLQEDHPQKIGAALSDWYLNDLVSEARPRAARVDAVQQIMA